MIVLVASLWMQSGSSQPCSLREQEYTPTPCALSRGFGSGLVTLPDVDDDGVPELGIGASLERTEEAYCGRLFIVSGRKAALLSQRPLSMPVRQSLQADGLDLDRDGWDEVFVMAADDLPLVVASGRTGRPLMRLHHDDPGGNFENFGSSVAPAGDLDQDGVVDVAVGCSEFGSDCEDDYAVELFSGRDGHALLSIDTRGKSVTVAAAGDFDSDGRLDLPVGLPEEDVVVVLDGRILQERLGSGGDARFRGRVGLQACVLRTFPRAEYSFGPGSGEEGAGTGIRTVADFDGDGFSDLVVGEERLSADGLINRPSLRYFSSRHSPVLPSTQRGTRFAHVDFDGDGVDDYLDAELDDHAGIYSGKTHEALRLFPEQRPFGYLEGFGASVAWAGDVNGDGVLDVAVGCSEFGIDSGDEYYVALFSGADAAVLRVLDSGRMHTVVGEGADFDRDGIPDLPVGLPEEGMVVILSGRGLSDPGTSKALRSGDWPVLWRLRSAQSASDSPPSALPSPPAPR